MKTLILTEKPSVARDFAGALKVRGKHDGYLEDDRFIITWTIGHLVELCEPHDYDPAWKPWRLDTLPILPATFKYKPIAGTRKQLNVIRNLIGRKPVERIVIATDAGREGELIARTVLEAAPAEQPAGLFRFWTSQALTPQVVRAGLNALKPASDFDRLWEAGRARQMADWLVGMNGSRVATLRMKDLFSVGRVQTAVLALLVDRFKARDKFTPEPYWLVSALFENPKGTWRGTWIKNGQSRLPTRQVARDLVSRITDRTGTVQSVKKEKKRQAPPLLYSLTDLQRDANSRFGLSAKHTLDIAQGLYEKRKCLSYPRTDARVLGSKNVALAAGLVKKLSAVYADVFSGVDPNLIRAGNRRVFNDARLTDHHALIPLAPLPAGATDTEGKIYHLVLRRFAAAFYPDCRFEQTEILTAVGGDDLFRTRGKVIIEPGWQALLKPQTPSKTAREDEPEQAGLPPLATGDPARVEAADIQEKQTTPPPEYTEALLLKDMTNPGRYVEENDLKKIYRGDVGLGTQATRAQIIETLISRQYVTREKKHLIATEKGIRLIDTLRTFKTASILASPEETARWEMTLEEIARGRGTAENFLKKVEAFIRGIIDEFRNAEIAPAPREVIGKCPRCGGDVIEGFKGYGCANYKKADGGCPFVIWKKIAKKSISPNVARRLLSGRKAGPFKGFVSKNNKRFAAALKLVREEDNWRVRFDFDDAPAPGAKTPSPASPASSAGADGLGTCPVCGGRVIEGKRGYGCANWRRQDGGCRFVIWKTISGKTLTPANIRTLTSGKKTRKYVFRTGGGKKFKAALCLRKTAEGAWETVLVDREQNART